MTKKQIEKAFYKMVFAPPIEFYETFRYHIGHKIEILDVWDWRTNREFSLELRCAEPSCEGCDPLLEMDMPKEI